MLPFIRSAFICHHSELVPHVTQPGEPCCLLQTSPLGSSKLAQHLIGPWLKAPKAARQVYEQYITTVAGCLGGEPSSAEIQEAAVGVWDALQHAPPPANLQQGRTSVATAVKPYR